MRRTEHGRTRLWIGMLLLPAAVSLFVVLYTHSSGLATTESVRTSPKYVTTTTGDTQGATTGDDDAQKTMDRDSSLGKVTTLTNAASMMLKKGKADATKLKKETQKSKAPFKKDLPAENGVSTSAGEATTPLKILLFLTSQFSELHVDFLNECWPMSLANSPNLLRSAHVLVFSAGPADTTLLRTVFSSNPSLQIEIYPNPGYQEGAILAMKEAIRNEWFQGYDWVIRLNPDVVLRDDSWLLGIDGEDDTWKGLYDRDLDAIFVDCYKHSSNARRFGDSHLLQSDFYVIRPDAIPANAFVGSDIRNAEVMVTSEFGSILTSGRYVWMKDAAPKRHAYCRVDSVRDNYDGPVIHNHDYLSSCKSDMEEFAKQKQHKR